MPKCSYKNFGITFGLILTLLIFFGPLAKAQNSDNFLRKKNLHPKMESVLSKLEEEHGKGAGYAKQFAKKRNIKLDERNRVTIFIYLEGDKPLNIKSLEAHGAEIIKGTNNVIKATVPVGMLRAIADNIEGVSFIKLPNKPISQTTSQGVGLTGASSYHSAGITGSGVKVAVIDEGFAGLTSATTHRELTSLIYVFDCTRSGCLNVLPPWNLFESDGHGTAVAEIVYDMAPDAQLYLMKIDDQIDLVDAKNFCIANGIKIINHSVGWFNTNFYDGQCYNSNPVCTANDAYANGILWVNSAGNYALEHYEATFTDADSDGFHDVFPSFIAFAGDPITIWLTWNAWPSTNQDYDLYLLDSLGNLVAWSEDYQTGTQTPTEQITINAPYTDTYYIRVYKYSATSNHKLELFVDTPNYNLNPAVASSSLVSPADALSVLAVAAINYNNWTTGLQESFSSQGPTTDGRIKPDISGPDNVSNYTYGAFSGTSAAAPHVAGAAALILSATRSLSLSVSNLRDALIASAIDMGVKGPDNVFGYGRLDLPSQVFVDVPLQNWAFYYINAIYNAHITTGCLQNPLSYCPEDNVTREQMAAFIIRTEEGEPPINYCDSGTPFTDVTPDMWSCRYIKRLKELGITKGYGDGRYGPYDLVPREQMAAFLVRAVVGEPPLNYCDSGSLFPDITPDMWSCIYIKRLKELAITAGYGDGRYGPYDFVTREQMAALLWRAFLRME
jgi:subtilisin family serine protease